MKNINLFFGILVVCMASVAGCKSNDHSKSHLREVSGQHSAGDRVGVHGMLVFGEAQHYLSHIPTFGRPHNEQLLMKVEIAKKDGQPLRQGFVDGGYSLRPSTHFPLDDLVTGHLTSFVGDIHQGNFEQGGAVLHKDVTVTVSKVLVARNLPSGVVTDSGVDKGFVVGTTKEAFLVHYITADRPYQQILALEEPGSKTPDLDGSQAPLIAIQAVGPFSGGKSVTGQLHSIKTAEKTLVTLDLKLSLICLKGPGFFQNCD